MISIRQVKAARALLGWSQTDLAEKSGVSAPTIKRLEAMGGPVGGRTGTAEAMRSALEAAGIEFIAENGGGAGVRLKCRIRHEEGLHPEELNSSNDD